jgi:hypothetical protein
VEGEWVGESEVLGTTATVSIANAVIIPLWAIRPLDAPRTALSPSPASARALAYLVAMARVLFRGSERRVVGGAE